MNSQLQGNGLDSGEIDLFEIWAKIKPVFARYKYWMVVTPEVVGRV